MPHGGRAAPQMLLQDRPGAGCWDPPKCSFSWKLGKGGRAGEGGRSGNQPEGSGADRTRPNVGRMGGIPPRAQQSGGPLTPPAPTAALAVPLPPCCRPLCGGPQPGQPHALGRVGEALSRPQAGGVDSRSPRESPLAQHREADGSAGSQPRSRLSLTFVKFTFSKESR